MVLRLQPDQGGQVPITLRSSIRNSSKWLDWLIVCGDMWSVLLEENGIAGVPADGARGTLRGGSQRATYTVVTTSSRVHPSDVTEPPAGNALLIVPALSEAAAQRARSRGWSAIPDEGPAWVLFHGREIKLKSPELATGSQQQSRRGRPGWGIFSVLRALLALEGGARHSEL